MKRTSFILFSLLLLIALPVAAYAQTGTPTGPARAQNGGVLQIGSSVQGTLSNSSPSLLYTFSGDSGQAVTITQTSSDFDSFLVLRDNTGTVLATDDDSAGNLDSRIGPFILPSSGTFTIVSDSYDHYNSTGIGVGTFTLTLAAAEVHRIEYSQTINGTLSTTSPSAFYTFRGQAGDAVTIALNSSDFDSYLSLSQAGNPSELTNNDDSGGTLNSLIGPYILPATGDYAITARSLDGTGVGSYTLTLTKSTVLTINYGDNKPAEITAASQQTYFAFQGTAGDVVDIAVHSNGAIDTTLTLNDPTNTQVATDDDSGEAFDPELTHVVLGQTGTYTIGVTPYSAGDTGAFTLSLQRGTLPSLDSGPQRITTSDKSSTQTVIFTGRAGERVHLSANLVSGTTSSPSITVTQAGTSVAYASGTSVTQLSLDFVVPADGPVLVQIDEYSYTRLTFEVTLDVVRS